MTDQPNFLNMVAEIATSISLGELLERVKKLEQDMGREDGPRFGPRLIDVDILMLEDQVVNQPDLQIPPRQPPPQGFRASAADRIGPRLGPPGPRRNHRPVG